MPATLITLAKFTGAPGLSTPAFVIGNLIADSSGDLFGTTLDGAETSSGLTDALFEIAKAPSGGYSPPSNLAVLPESIDAEGLVADANGDLFGTTFFGGANGKGTVFEIAKGATSSQTLVSFDGDDGSGPNGSLFVDSSGDLFGTTSTGSGAARFGTVFEIKKTAGVYATAPTTLATLSPDDNGGTGPQGSLIADSQGDLFGTTASGGNGDGAVFEIQKIAGSYATTATTLASFSTIVGVIGDLIADKTGDLFGTTTGGGGLGFGSIFEIVKTGDAYSPTPKILASLPLGDGELSPSNSLFIDANGDLFGTTEYAGVDGTVFEIVNTPTGYERTPKVIVSFNRGVDGSDPQTTLIADAEGNLFGATQGGTGIPEGGTVFEITDSGFVTGGPRPGVGGDLLFQSTDGQAAIWSLTGTKVTEGGTVSPNPGPGWKAAATADFNGDGHTDILWQNTSTGQTSIWEMNGNLVTGGGTLAPNLGAQWKVVGTGDFNDDLRSDILWQNADGQLAISEGNGQTAAPAQAVIPNPGAAWKAVGTGDFNGDGDSDIILQNTNGQVAIWEMNGNELIGGGLVNPNPGPGWKLVGSGDFNNDGHSDLLWQNTSSGQVAIWEMNGTKIIGGGALTVDPGLSWHAIGTGSEGTSADILFQNSASGQTAIWDMNGTNIASGGTVGPAPGPSWKAVGLGL